MTAYDSPITAYDSYDSYDSQGSGMEALAGSSSMRAGMRVLLDEAVRRGLNFVFAGAVIGMPATLAVL